mgnify:CR=1 FL=1
MAETRKLLELRDVHAWYGESHILHGIDLEVREGEVVTLLGRNGAGKTSTLRSIARLGDRPMDDLIERVGLPPEQLPAPQRDAIVVALVQGKSDRAARGLAPLLLKGPMPDRLRLLRLSPLCANR